MEARWDVEVSPAPTLYETLGVAPSASTDDIKRAWRSAARRFHPDKNPDDAAADQFKAASAAWEVLGDIEKRRRYDLSLYRPSGCARCGQAVISGHQLCIICGIRAYQDAETQRRRAVRQARRRRPPPPRREPPPPPRRTPTYEERMEAKYAWVGEPENFDRMMYGDRSPDDYRPVATGVSADELLGALLSEAALRSARVQPRGVRRAARPGVRVTIEINDVNVTVDSDTIANMRRIHRSLGAANSLFRRMRDWFD